jgi:hypothetical protein
LVPLEVEMRCDVLEHEVRGFSHHRGFHLR